MEFERNNLMGTVSLNYYETNVIKKNIHTLFFLYSFNLYNFVSQYLLDENKP